MPIPRHNLIVNPPQMSHLCLHGVGHYINRWQVTCILLLNIVVENRELWLENRALLTTVTEPIATTN